VNAWQLQRVENFVEDIAQQRGHTMQDIVVKPSLGNNILWRSTYIANDKIYVDAVRAGISAVKHYPGGEIKLLQQDELREKFPADSVLFNDIQRFTYFSDDYIAWYPGRENVIGDVRYALLPDSIEPLWGIEIDADQSDQHARFVTFRDNSKSKRDRFWSMLKGDDVLPLEITGKQ
jgi:inner membrane protein